MKKNLVAFFGLSRWGVGAVALTLCAFAPASRADVTVINNLADIHDGGVLTAVDGGTSYAQTFNAGSSGNISSLTLSLGSSSGTMNVYLYDAGTAPALSGGGINLGTKTLLGSVAAGTGIVSLSSNPFLNTVDYYSIALVPAASGSDSIAWNSTTTAGSGGAGTSFYAVYSSANSGLTWAYDFQNPYLQMNLSVSPVPEVPVTGVVMGFGALAIAVGGSLRRKMRPAVSSIA